MVVRVNRKMSKMPMCKLNFDEEEDDYSNTGSNCNNDVDMEILGDNNFSSPLNGPSRHVFSPRKPSYRYHHSPTNSISPPDKRIRALRLFDSPNTPKTLLQKSTVDSTTPSNIQHGPRNLRNSGSRVSSRSRLQFPSQSTSQYPSQNSHLSNGISSRSRIGNSNCETISECAENDPEVSSGSTKNMRANVNPFTPDNIMMSSRKRMRKNRKSSSR